MMKKIGFVDYYLSEWHANHYPAWIAEICEKRGLSYRVEYAWALEDKSQVDGKTTEQWCKEFGVKPCATARELCEKSDVIVILAPSDPQMHLSLAKQTFPYARGKRFYIDKTFAPDSKTAKEIIALADQYGISFFSTSALRYADEITGYENCEKSITFGGGGNFDEYIIHQVEMTVKTMGIAISQAKTVSSNNGYDCLVEFKDGRTSEMHYDPTLGFKVCLTKDGEQLERSITSDFFKNLTEKILLFFEGEAPDFSRKQTLAVMALRDAVIESINRHGERVSVYE